MSKRDTVIVPTEEDNKKAIISLIYDYANAQLLKGIHLDRFIKDGQVVARNENTKEFNFVDMLRAFKEKGIEELEKELIGYSVEALQKRLDLIVEQYDDIITRYRAYCHASLSIDKDDGMFSTDGINKRKEKLTDLALNQLRNTLKPKVLETQPIEIVPNELVDVEPVSSSWNVLDNKIKYKGLVINENNSPIPALVGSSKTAEEYLQETLTDITSGNRFSLKTQLKNIIKIYKNYLTSTSQKDSDYILDGVTGFAGGGVYVDHAKYDELIKLASDAIGKNEKFDPHEVDATMEKLEEMGDNYQNNHLPFIIKALDKLIPYQVHLFTKSVKEFVIAEHIAIANTPSKGNNIICVILGGDFVDGKKIALIYNYPTGNNAVNSYYELISKTEKTGNTGQMYFTEVGDYAKRYESIYKFNGSVDELNSHAIEQTERNVLYYFATLDELANTNLYLNEINKMIRKMYKYILDEEFTLINPVDVANEIISPDDFEGITNEDEHVEYDSEAEIDETITEADVPGKTYNVLEGGEMLSPLNAGFFSNVKIPGTNIQAIIPEFSLLSFETEDEEERYVYFGSECITRPQYERQRKNFIGKLADKYGDLVSLRLSALNPEFSGVWVPTELLDHQGVIDLLVEDYDVDIEDRHDISSIELLDLMKKESLYLNLVPITGEAILNKKTKDLFTKFEKQLDPVRSRIKADTPLYLKYSLVAKVKTPKFFLEEQTILAKVVTDNVLKSIGETLKSDINKFDLNEYHLIVDEDDPTDVSSESEYAEDIVGEMSDFIEDIANILKEKDFTNFRQQLVNNAEKLAKAIIMHVAINHKKYDNSNPKFIKKMLETYVDESLFDFTNLNLEDDSVDSIEDGFQKRTTLLIQHQVNDLKNFLKASAKSETPIDIDAINEDDVRVVTEDEDEIKVVVEPTKNTKQKEAKKMNDKDVVVDEDFEEEEVVEEKKPGIIKVVLMAIKSFVMWITTPIRWIFNTVKNWILGLINRNSTMGA